MNLQEIKEALKADPKLAKELSVYVMTETDSGKELLKDHAKVEVDKAVNGKSTAIFTDIEDSIFTVLGVKKNEGEEVTDFIKRISSDLKDLRAKETELNADAKVTELEAKIKTLTETGEANTHWKNLHDKAVVKFDGVVTKLKKDLEDKDEAFMRQTIKSDLMGGLSGLEFIENAPQEAIDALTEKKTEAYLKTAKIVDNKVIYCKEDGEPIIGKDYKPVTAKAIWGEALGTLIKTDAPDGGGANPIIEGGRLNVVEKDGKEIKRLSFKTGEFSTKQEFYALADKALKEASISQRSEEYKETLQVAVDEYKVDELPMS